MYIGKSDIIHDDVIEWKHFPRYWPFVRGIQRYSVNSQHKGQWRGALMFSLNCARINGWVSNDEVGDLRRHRAHYDVIVMHELAAIYKPSEIIRAIPCTYDEACRDQSPCLGYRRVWLVNRDSIGGEDRPFRQPWNTDPSQTTWYWFSST